MDVLHDQSPLLLSLKNRDEERLTLEQPQMILKTTKNLSHKNLSKTDLTEANADLRGTNLSQANLQGVNLTQANLRGANLSRADLNEAYFTNAKMEGLKNIDKAKNKEKAKGL